MNDILQQTFEVDGKSVTVQQMLDIAQSAATLVKAGKEVLMSDEGDMAEALFSAGLITSDEYDEFIGV